MPAAATSKPARPLVQLPADVMDVLSHLTVDGIHRPERQAATPADYLPLAEALATEPTEVSRLRMLQEAAFAARSP